MGYWRQIFHMDEDSFFIRWLISYVAFCILRGWCWAAELTICIWDVVWHGNVVPASCTMLVEELVFIGIHALGGLMLGRVRWVEVGAIFDACFEMNDLIFYWSQKSSHLINAFMKVPMQHSSTQQDTFSMEFWPALDPPCGAVAII